MQEMVSGSIALEVRRKRVLAALLFVVFCLVENVRQRNFNSIVLSSTADLICTILVVVHFRKLSWLFWSSLGFSVLMGCAHWLAIGIEIPLVMFCAKSLPVMIGALEVVSHYERSPIGEQWRQSSYRLLATLAVVLAGYALAQHLSGFRYVEAENIYNGISVGGEENTIRLPSIFFSYVNYAKFGLATGIILYQALIKGLAPKVWLVPGLVGATFGLVLSGQRAALTVFAVTVVFQSLSPRRAVFVGLVVAVSAIIPIASAALDLGGYLSFAAKAFSTSRIEEQFLPSFFDWFESTPWLGWGFGTGGGGGVARLTSAGPASADILFGYKPATMLEGSIPYLLLGGGVPWLLAHILASVVAFIKSSPIARQWLVAIVLWSMTHTMVDSAQTFIICMLLTGIVVGTERQEQIGATPADCGSDRSLGVALANQQPSW